MKNFCLPLSFFFLFCFVQKGISQEEQKIILLKGKSSLLKKDTAAANVYNQLADLYLKNNPDSCLKYADEALVLSSTISYNKGQADARLIQGKYFNVQGKYPEALDNFFKAANIYENSGDSLRAAYCYNGIGGVYFNQDNLEKAKIYFLQFTGICERFGDTVNVSMGYNNLGSIAHRQKDYSKALEYYSNTLRISEARGYQKGIAVALRNIGAVYVNDSDYVRGLDFNLRALKIQEVLNDKKSVALSNLIIGEIYQTFKNYPKALEHEFKADTLSKEIGFTDGIRLAYYGLSTTYSLMKNYKEAFKFSRKSSEISDTLFSEQASQQVNELTVRYETEKKQKQIELLNQQKEIRELSFSKQKLQLILVISGLLLSIVIAYLLFVRYRLRQKQLHTKAIFDAEHNERIRIARDMHDELGSGLTKLAHISDSAKKLPEDVKNLNETISSISYSSRQLILKMSDLVWTLNPENATLENLFSRIREFIYDCEAEYPIKFSIDIEKNIPSLTIDRESKKNIYLFVKEAVNNALKYSNASELKFLVNIADGNLEILISDKGQGFDEEKIKKTRSGLGNMRMRVESIGGKYSLKTNVGQGTIITATIPLKNISASTVGSAAV